MLVLLDLDNTLVDRDGAFASWATDFIGAVEGDEADLAWLIGIDAQGYAPRQVIAEALIERFDLARDAKHLVTEMRSALLASIQTYSGVPERLRALRDAGARLVIVTNGASTQQRSKVEKAGLTALVDEVVVSEEVGAKKPSPAIFAAARGSFEGSPVWMLGDNPRADIEGAQGMGFETGWVSHGSDWPGSIASPTLTGANTASLLDQLVALHDRDSRA